LDRSLGEAPADVDLAKVVSSIQYIGSPEHKDAPSFAGERRPRADASKCDQRLNDPEPITEWLRTAVRKGAFGKLWEGGFPRYLWYKDGEVLYEGRLVNRGLGQYKGYPLERDEWPPDITRLYD
jgi:hypothetical protein